MDRDSVRKLVSTAAFAAAVLAPTVASATPSSTVWTPLSLDIQPYGVGHWGVENYFTVFRKAEDGGGSFPTDAGFTIGVLPGDKLKLELGVDLIEASDDPLYFNAKLGYTEGGLFDGAPALQLGIANVGTESGVTNQNLVYFVVGKTVPHLGRLSVAPYYGNADVLVDAEGEEENTGVMVAFDRGFHAVKGPEGEFNRFVLAADYASGDNALGGGAVGLYYYFTPNVSLLTGPVWFNEEAINGKWKWTIQLDVNHPWFGGGK
jgi:hypothetical protein